MIKLISRLLKSVAGEHAFIRSIYAETLLENFFVSAIAALLGMRLFLSLTDYPTLGGENFHIAHMLFGGVFMLIGMIILLAFLNHASHDVAAVVGGAGFGLFIDELGKFITDDNNYFFQPAIALIYIIFVVIYLAIRWINRGQVLSREEALANAFEIAKQASLSSMDPRDQQLFIRLLNISDPDDPLTQNLKDMITRIASIPAHQPDFIIRLKRFIDNLYQTVATKWWFTGAVIAFFVFSSGFTLYGIIALVVWSWVLIIWIVAGIVILLFLTREERSGTGYLETLVSLGVIAMSIFIAWVILSNLKTTPASFSDFAQLSSSTISAVLIIIGIALMRTFRLGAYFMFRRAILVSILLTRVFSFYEYQFFALLGLAGDVIVLIAIRYMIRQEQIRLGRTNYIRAQIAK